MTKGQLEAEITSAITHFERDYLGRGPKEAQAFIVQDMIVVRLKGILSQGERQLATETGGIELIKQMRMRLIESVSRQLAQIIEEHTKIKVTTMHTDISTRSGERMFVFILSEDLEQKFPM